MVSRRVSAAQCQRSCPVLQWAGGRSGADSGDLRLWRWVRARTRWCHERVKDRMARTGIHRPLQATDRLATAHGRVRASLRRCGRAFRGLPGPTCRLLPGGDGGGPLPGASGPSPTRYPAQPRRVAGQSVPSVPSFVAWRCTCWRPSSTGPVLPELAFSPESGHVGRPRPARGSSARSRWPSDSSRGSSAGWGLHTTLVAIARASVVGRRHGRHEDPQRRTEGEVEHQVRSRCAVRSGSATSSTIRRNRAGSANSMSTATAP